MTQRYEVLTYTICQGWINTWGDTDEHGNEVPQTFESVEAAQKELREHVQDVIAMQRDDGREPDECDDFDSLMEEYRIEPARPDSHKNGLRAIYTGKEA